MPFAALANGNVTLFVNGTNITTNPYSRVIEIDPRTGPQISGAQRLPTGNTLICEGQWGRFFEVTPEGDIVWEYVSPFKGPAASVIRRTKCSAPIAMAPIRRSFVGGQHRSMRKAMGCVPLQIGVAATETPRMFVSVSSLGLAGSAPRVARLMGSV